MTERPYGIAALDRPRRLPRAGRIRLGEKDISKSGKEFPRELDYFNVVDAPMVASYYAQERGISTDQAVADISRALQLRELDLIFPVNDVRSILDLGYMMYGATGWKCRGNGVTAYNREVDDEIECAGEDCKMVADGKCKRQGVLTFICYLVPGLCVHDCVTSSWRTIENWLAMIETLQDLFGRIDGIPLKMYREPYESTYTDGDGKQHRQVHHCCRLDVAASLLDVKRLQLGGGQPLELEPAGDECADDMYPRSVQREAAALPAGQVLEAPKRAADPSWQAEPVAPAPVVDPTAALLAEIPEGIRNEITSGFDIAERTPEQQMDLLERYKGQPDRLFAYLSALVDNVLQGKPAPKPAPKVDQRPVPAAAQGKGGWTF